MADWRARGYVADSDEEDDSQPVSLTIFATSPEISGNFNDTFDTDRPLNKHGKAPTTAKVIKVVVQVNEEIESRNSAVDESRTHTASQGSECRPQDKEHETTSSAVTLNKREQYGELSDYDEIDELQQARYKATPSAQLEAELLHGAQDDTSQGRSNAFPQSFNQKPQSPASSLLSSGLPESHSSRASTKATLNDLKIQSNDGEDDSGIGPGIQIPAPDERQAPETEPPAAVDVESSRRARNLRHRNPIQLHPYQIESEKYRQILKARGVKPLRIAQVEAEASDAFREETQNVDYEGEESQLNDREDNLEDTSLSPLGTQVTAGDVYQDPNNAVDFKDDDLPDLDALLCNPSTVYIGNGYKRRKITSPSFKMPEGFRLDKRLNKEANSALEDNDHVFNVPPSPPHSGSQTPRNAIRRTESKFHFPRKASSPALPTPVTSSEPRRRAFLVVAEDDKDENNSPQKSSVALADESSVSSETSSENESSSEIQRAQREIRGVLPASWLKLDPKSQSGKRRKNQYHRSNLLPEKVGLQRGVARPMVTGTSKSPDLSKLQQGPLEFSEDEGTSSKIQGHQSPLYAEMKKVSYNDDVDTFLTNRWGEAMEDDRVDAMLPSATRLRARHRKGTKLQTKLADLGGQSCSGLGGLTKDDSTRRPRQPKITETFDKGRRRKLVVRPPRLSILDAPVTRERPQTPVPYFLKIASRTARGRKDKGRHSPTRKYLRLATKNDDSDTSKTLRDWREGTFVAMPNSDFDAKAGRLPLYPRSANATFPPNAPDHIKTPVKSSLPFSKSSSARTHGSFKRPRKVQALLDHVLQKQNSNGNSSNDALEVARVPQTNHNFKKHGQLVSTLRAHHDTRPAMLERQRKEDQVHEQALFERDLSRINHLDDGSGLPNVLRLFDRDLTIAAVSQSICPGENKTVTHPKVPIVHRRRKRRPQQVEVSTASWGQPSTPIELDKFPNDPPFARGFEARSKYVLLGLGRFGNRFSGTLDITPLPTGTYFHKKTIIGSGVFASSLRLADPNVPNHARSYLVWTYEQKSFTWGPWNEIVSSELGETIGLISQSIQCVWASGDHELTIRRSGKAISMLKDIVSYFSAHVSFFDDIDRVACVQKTKALTFAILNEVDQRSTDETNSATLGILKWRTHFCLQVSTLNLILVNRLYQLAKHELIPAQLRQDVLSVMRKTAQLTLKLALNGDFEAFEACMIRLKHPTTADYSIGEQQHSIEAFVIAQHVVSQYQDLKPLTLEVMHSEVPIMSSDGVFDVQVMEQYWRKLFTLLPFLEFNTRGVLETGRRFKVMFENWTFVKKLISPVLEVSLKNPEGQAPSFNTYFRAIFERCLHLINGWGWRRCEAIIGMLFDFFARNNLAHLRNEESHGSPVFLGQLEKEPPLIAEPEDRGFHIMLKIIGSGLKQMGRLYPEKKIRDIVWRLMPNHGRFHPKEESIRQEDLDALQNHHDLLCTLYWASPPGCRPRLAVIRNLVNLENSHRVACHINIRAWFNLVKFQLSTDEPVESLGPFAEWHDHLLCQILRQHTLARTEAEDHVKSAQQDGGFTVSKGLLESTVARNQRQVEAILSDALVCLKLAVDAAKNERAAAIFMSATVTRIFDLFDARRLQAFKVIEQSLDVLSAYGSKCVAQNTISRDENDDSQDYGDWPALDEDDELGLPSNEPEGSLLMAYQEPLRHLLSNCFGSDVIPNDILLLKLVDVWVAVAQVLVHKGKKSWNDYIGRFGTDSWISLRDTEQTRKYKVYYLSALIEKDSGILQDHPTFFLTSWIVSLVERESLLKFQHRFTRALLNSALDMPIVKNLPFWADATTGLFHISASEFAERRLSIISTVLSNMRVAVEQAVLDPAMDAMRLRQEYKDLLKYLMGAMKHNYQELGHGSNVRGAYVDFVHRVVEFLQQHTSTMCPIDRFFTDNGAFPLPAMDPTYVVGQLKSYALRLQDPRTPKQLVAFLQSVSERAAIDGQQPYLVGQLHTAMSNIFEEGLNARPTLRSFLVKVVLPAYISLAFTHGSGWILALPYLQALRKVFGQLLGDLDGTKTGSVVAMTSMVTTFLDSLRQSLRMLLYQSEIFNEAPILKMISACYLTITALLPVLDYLIRLPGSTTRAEKDMKFLRSVADYVSAQLQGDHDAFASDIDNFEKTPNEEIRNFATHELRDTLVKNWTCHDGQHYVVRCSTRREVVVDIGLYEEEKQELSMALEGFFDCLRAMPALKDEDEDERMKQRTMVNSIEALVI